MSGVRVPDSPPFGGIAQLVERLHGMQEVSGSIPLTSTRIRKGTDYYRFLISFASADAPSDARYITHRLPPAAFPLFLFRPHIPFRRPAMPSPMRQGNRVRLGRERCRGCRSDSSQTRFPRLYRATWRRNLLPA